VAIIVPSAMTTGDSIENKKKRLNRKICIPWRP
jgi:hypothetical protein